MRITRGLTFGFIVGAVIGLLLYLRMQRERRELAPQKQRYLQLNVSTETAPRARTIPAPPTPVPAKGKDPLEQIHGIGPVYAGRLYDAGVTTFAELAARSPAELAEIIGPRAGLADLDAWIAEAKTRSANRQAL